MGCTLKLSTNELEQALMIKSIGRLKLDDYKLMDSQVEKIFINLGKDRIELATELITEMANTPNYFVREEFGKRLATYEGPGAMEEVCSKLLEDHIYGIRATALFYFYYSNIDDLPVLLQILAKTVETVKWESEHILGELWKSNSSLMKAEMPKWALSPSAKKRAMSMHGMEQIVLTSPQFVLTHLERLIDDEESDVHENFVKLLIQVGRHRPQHAYVNIHRWLKDGSEDRARLLWDALKVLASIVARRERDNQSGDFWTLTKRVVGDWRKDPSALVAQMGSRLSQIIQS